MGKGRRRKGARGEKVDVEGVDIAWSDSYLSTYLHSVAKAPL